MFKGKITKLTSGAAMLGVAPTLALQAQGGVDVASKEATKRFLQENLNSSVDFRKIFGWGIFGVIAIIGVVFLVKYFASGEGNGNVEYNINGDRINDGQEQFIIENDDNNAIKNGNNMINYNGENVKNNYLGYEKIDLKTLTLEEAEKLYEKVCKDYEKINEKATLADEEKSQLEKKVDLKKNFGLLEGIENIKKGFESDEIKKGLEMMNGKIRIKEELEPNRLELAKDLEELEVKLKAEESKLLDAVSKANEKASSGIMKKAEKFITEYKDTYNRLKGNDGSLKDAEKALKPFVVEIYEVIKKIYDLKGKLLDKTFLHEMRSVKEDIYKLSSTYGRKHPQRKSNMPIAITFEINNSTYTLGYNKVSWLLYDGLVLLDDVLGEVDSNGVDSRAVDEVTKQIGDKKSEILKLDEEINELKKIIVPDAIGKFCGKIKEMGKKLFESKEPASDFVVGGYKLEKGQFNNLLNFGGNEAEITEEKLNEVEKEYNNLLHYLNDGISSIKNRIGNDAIPEESLEELETSFEGKNEIFNKLSASRSRLCNFKWDLEKVVNVLKYQKNDLSVERLNLRCKDMFVDWSQT